MLLQLGSIIANNCIVITSIAIISMYYSGSWENKVIPSAWWVWGDQVSKSGELILFVLYINTSISVLNINLIQRY